jgi:hypothetical protein
MIQPLLYSMGASATFHCPIGLVYCRGESQLEAFFKFTFLFLLEGGDADWGEELTTYIDSGLGAGS